MGIIEDEESVSEKETTKSSIGMTEEDETTTEATKPLKDKNCRHFRNETYSIIECKYSSDGAESTFSSSEFFDSGVEDISDFQNEDIFDFQKEHDEKINEIEKV